MGYVDLARSSGLGQFTMTDISRFFRQTEPAFRTLTTVPTEAIKRAQTDPKIELALRAERLRRAQAEETAVMPRRPGVLEPAVVKILETIPRIRPTRKPVTTKMYPSLYIPTTETKRRFVEPMIPSLRPLRFRQKGIAPKVIKKKLTRGGATQQATDVNIVAGPDPVAKHITGAGAPLTGQDLSLKESSPIVPVGGSPVGVTIIDQPTPIAMPVISFEPLEIKRPEVKEAGLSPLMILVMVGIALPLLLKKKR